MTPTQKDLSDRIIKFWADHETGPSYRELALLTGTAVSNIYRMVERLAERGVLHVDKGMWRGIYPIDEWRKKNQPSLPERTYRDEYERKLLVENQRMREALKEIRDIADVSEGTELYVMIAEKGLGD
tara:strand:- start:971 stop:1351 length:381 start_codon:yes stop_codon:yes gene_type:complete